MLVGNLGSSQRFDYTAIGDTINLAARLEGINKRFGTIALASADTVVAADGTLITRLVGHVQVAGRARPVAVHELLGLHGDPVRIPAAVVARFHHGLEAYRARRFSEARECFEEVRQSCGGSDGPSELYLDLIAQHEGRTLSADWDGVIALTEK
jgi:adenylate cyclase